LRNIEEEEKEKKGEKRRKTKTSFCAEVAIVKEMRKGK